ncbi:DUF4920 domain-containing protein [Sulfidibacter corallicola]|uniref:DUF4920 domain-containing protein n=1 Tax=Sulfidibacter corallicola TaxID=2818388 RepID=A0A8A4TTA6_SULCO|nr:DUF4920 domain-containing protein [Sulfidibacter corallicola]QTD53196.1 DUF4920 domain-containing protein [Sulfidibacter corallicola]
MLLVLLCSMFIYSGSASPEIYGKAPKSETPIITIEAFAKNPEAYMDKVVRVEGEVQEVCPKAGCWLDISDGKESVRIKVKDGEIVFKQKMVGKKVIAEGTVYKFDLTREQAVNYFAHLAEEKNEPFDPATVTEGTTIYQIGGIGVRVLGAKKP